MEVCEYLCTPSLCALGRLGDSCLDSIHTHVHLMEVRSHATVTIICHLATQDLGLWLQAYGSMGVWDVNVV